MAVPSSAPSRWRLLLFGALTVALILALAEGVARAVAGPPTARYFFDKAGTGIGRKSYKALFPEWGHDPFTVLPPSHNPAVPWFEKTEAPLMGPALVRSRAAPWVPGHLGRTPLPLAKPERTYRILAVGGSSVYGQPGAEGRAFPEQLQALLSQRPSHHYEVYNLANPGFDSFDFTGILAEAVAAHPDLVIFYAGHNDTGNSFFRGTNLLPADPDVIRLQVFLSSRLRLYSLLRDALVPTREALAPPPASDTRALVQQRAWARTNQLRLARDNFTANLRRCVRMVREAGGEALMIQVVSDIKMRPHVWAHFTWLEEGEKARFDAALTQAMQGGPGALEAAHEAAQLDPTHALASWHLGSELLSQGRNQEALTWLTRAKDHDVASVRAWSGIVEAMGETAQDLGVTLLDARQILAGRDGLPDRSYFIDDLHLNVKAHQRLAAEIAPHIP